jgi:predicted ferric reductase
VAGSGPPLTRQRVREPAWLAVSLPAVPALLLWLVTPGSGQALSTPAGALRQLAFVAGLCAYAGFATTLVLGARIPVLERLFRSLDRMYLFHRRLGVAVGALLAAHALLMAGSYAATPQLRAVDVLLPDPGWQIFAGVVAFALLVVLLTTSLLVRLRHEVFLRVHRLFGVVFAVASLHVLRVGGVGSPALDIYLGILTVVGLTAWLYRSGLGRTLVRRHYYRVAQVRPVHPSVVELTLTPVEERLRFEPGQMVFVGLDDPAVGRELHPFSITSKVGEHELRLVIKAVGDFTANLRDVYQDSWARVEGPYGGFWHNGAALPRQVWIAGGIGITPFLSMARSIDASAHAIDLYYATEDAETAVFLDELYTIADRQPTLRVIPVRADALGFLSAADVRAASGDLKRQHIFMCGPPAMIDALSSQFAELGVPRDRLHYEEFRLKPG